MTPSIFDRAWAFVSEYRAPNPQRYTRGEGFWTHPKDENNTNFFEKSTYPRSQREDWYDVTTYVAEFRCTLSNVGLFYVGFEQNCPALIFAGAASAISHAIPKQWLLTLDKVAMIAVILTLAREYETILNSPLIMACGVVAFIINLSDSYLSRLQGKTWPHVLWHLSAAFLTSIVLKASK